MQGGKKHSLFVILDECRVMLIIIIIIIIVVS